MLQLGYGCRTEFLAIPPCSCMSAASLPNALSRPFRWKEYKRTRVLRCLDLIWPEVEEKMEIEKEKKDVAELAAML